jgi:hypothetical protein
MKWRVLGIAFGGVAFVIVFISLQSVRVKTPVPKSVERPPIDVLQKRRGDALLDMRMSDAEDQAWRDNLEMAIRTSLSTINSGEVSVRKLVSILQQHLVARTSSSADDLVSLLSNDTGRWLSPDEDERTWKVLAGGFQEVTGQPLRRDAPGEVLRALYTFDLEKGCARIAKIAGEPDALRVVVGRAASAALVEGPAEMTPDDRDLWSGFGSEKSFVLRRARRSLEVVLGERRAVQYAQVWIVLESHCAKRYVWFSSWFWDEALQEWGLARSALLGGDAPHAWRM